MEWTCPDREIFRYSHRENTWFSQEALEVLYEEAMKAFMLEAWLPFPTFSRLILRSEKHLTIE